jgi:hypothetical protein
MRRGQDYAMEYGLTRGERARQRREDRAALRAGLQAWPEWETLPPLAQQAFDQMAYGLGFTLAGLRRTLETRSRPQLRIRAWTEPQMDAMEEWWQANPARAVADD